MKKKYVFIMLLAIFMLAGCSTVTNLRTDVPVLVNINKNDFTVGEMLSAELPYNPRYYMLKEELLGKALEGTEYDFLFMPKYQIINGDTIKVTGYGAKIK